MLTPSSQVELGMQWNLLYSIMAILARSNSLAEIMFLCTKIAFNTDNYAAVIIHSIDINDPKENELLVLIYLYEVSHQSNLQWDLSFGEHWLPLLHGSYSGVIWFLRF